MPPSESTIEAWISRKPVSCSTVLENIMFRVFSEKTSISTAAALTRRSWDVRCRMPTASMSGPWRATLSAASASVAISWCTLPWLEVGTIYWYIVSKNCLNFSSSAQDFLARS